MISLTLQQGRALKFIRGHIALHDGVAPSYMEIARHIGLKSRSSVHRVIGHLEARGKLLRVPGRYRAYELIEVERCCPHCGKRASAPRSKVAA